MGKDFKEKYSRICSIKEKAISLIEMGMAQDVKDINSKELYELMDIIKDCEESIKLAEEAKYFCSVVEAMEDSTESEKKYYMDKYIPETAMYYTPMSMVGRNRRMYTEPMWHDDDVQRDRMYYSSMSGLNSVQNGSHMNYNDEMRDAAEGRSPLTRKAYMHATDKTTKNKEFEHYISDLSSDISEMYNSMSTEDKANFKQKLSVLVSKMP